VSLKDSEKLRLAIASKGHSQTSFAKLVDISQPYLNQIINMDKQPSPVVAKKICDGLGMSIEDIFFVTSDCQRTHSIISDHDKMQLLTGINQPL